MERESNPLYKRKTFLMTDRTNLASKLADLKLFQKVLMTSEQKLMAETDDSKIRERLEKMISQDQENMTDIDQAIAKFGVFQNLAISLKSTPKK